MVDFIFLVAYSEDGFKYSAVLSEPINKDRDTVRAWLGEGLNTNLSEKMFKSYRIEVAKYKGKEWVTDYNKYRVGNKYSVEDIAKTSPEDFFECIKSVIQKFFVVGVDKRKKYIYSQTGASELSVVRKEIVESYRDS